MTDEIGECIICENYLDKKGYGYQYYRGKVRLAHRVSYVIANNISWEEIIGKVVRHKCDNPSCINPNHLEIGDHADNYRDMVERGRRKLNPVQGMRHASAKLTDDEVREIRKRYCPFDKKDGATPLAAEFNVSNQVIVSIAKRKIWKHLP